MNILMVGALAWNPERVCALAGRGHKLYGLWSRTMGWEQGPYRFASNVITDVDVDGAVDLLRDGDADIVYSLFQIYDRTLWARDAGPGVEDIWGQLRRLMRERGRGTFDVPMVRHWGFDVHNLDLEVVRAFDGQIFCNRHRRDYWTRPRKEGGCGLDLGCEGQEIAFMDSDLPSEEFMNSRFSQKLSDSDGEIHTVCVGRPLGIDVANAARAGIHVHVYGNNFDDIASTVASGITPAGFSRLQGMLGDYLHIHRSLQPTGESLDEIRTTKQRWVEEFSRYDAGWSYAGRPLPWPRLEDMGAIPNRLGTYLLAGLPVITDRLPGYYRYDMLDSRGVAVDFVRRDYGLLAETLRQRERLDAMTERARSRRAELSFESTIDPLFEFLERIRDRYRHGRRNRRAPESLTPETIRLDFRPVWSGGTIGRSAGPGGWRNRFEVYESFLSARGRWLQGKLMGRYVAEEIENSRESRPRPGEGSSN